MTPSPDKAKRWRPRFSVRTLVIVVTLVCFTLWWSCLRNIFFDSGVRLIYERGGTPGAVTFVVRDYVGNPVEGVTVDAEGYSGWYGDGERTNAAGHAAVYLSECDVLAVRVDGREIRFRSMILDSFFSPPCRPWGLIANVVIEQ